ncbi:MAG: hypothetical protein H5U02_01405 [Clostridia bacterium]|nr:hypothetical protein [Clostridia bacterium]
MLPAIPRRTTWKQTRKRRDQLGFVYDQERDIYICRRGKKLYREKSEDASWGIRHHTHAYAYRGCDLKGVCAKGERCTIRCSGSEDLLGKIRNHLESAGKRKS